MLTGQVIGTPGVGGVVAKSYNPDKSVMTDNSQISGLKGIDNNSKFLDTGFAARWLGFSARSGDGEESSSLLAFCSPDFLGTMNSQVTWLTMWSVTE